MTLLQWTPMNACGCENPDSIIGSRRQSQNTSEKQAAWFPTTDIYDTEKDYVLKMEIPGFAKEDVDIEFKDSILSIKGNRKETDETQKDCVIRNERRSGGFARSFKFPRDVDGSKIGASLKEGVLELRVAKPEERKPQTIDISFN
jgi:HSP20 family protein